MARLLDGLGALPVAGIEKEHVKTIMRKFAGTVGKAVKRMLSVLLSFAVEEGWIKTNPAFGLDKKRRKRRTADEHGDRVEAGQRPLEEAEIAKVRKRNPYGTRGRAIFECLLGTGYRRSDSRRMPSDLADRPTIPLVTNKSGQVVIAPVTDEMR
jgi:site-specific recombinase XerC